MHVAKLQSGHTITIRGRSVVLTTGSRGDVGYFRTIEGERRFFRMGSGDGASERDNGGTYGEDEHARVSAVMEKIARSMGVPEHRLKEIAEKAAHRHLRGNGAGEYREAVAAEMKAAGLGPHDYTRQQHVATKAMAARVARERGVPAEHVDEVADRAAHRYLKSGGKDSADMHRAVAEAAKEVADKPKPPPPPPEPERPAFDEARARAFAEQAHAKVLEIGREVDEKEKTLQGEIDRLGAEVDRWREQGRLPKSRREGMLSAGEIHQKVNEIYKASFRLGDQKFRLRFDPAVLDERVSRVIDTIAHPDGPAAIHIGAARPEDGPFIASHSNARAGYETFSRLAGKGSALDGKMIEIGRDTLEGDRANSTGGRINLAGDSSAATVAHELGHELEFADAKVLRESLKFRDASRTSEVAIPLKRAADSSYREDEKAFPGNYPDLYCGKDYGERASEIVSMGLTHLLSDPVGFAQKYPEYFKFTLMQLHRR